MAGIGFVLRRMVRDDHLSSNVGGFAHATMASSGPWLMTCMALAAIAWYGRQHMGSTDLQQFSALVLYNFSLSLVVMGAVVLVATRRLADAIHARDVTSVPGMLFGALAVAFGLLSLLGVPLYGWVLELTLAERLLSFAGLLLTGGIWLLTAFLSALKSFGRISLSFLTGMAAAVASAALLGAQHGLAGLLAGFTLGMAVVFFSLMAQVLREYTGPASRPFAFLADCRGYWTLALTGLLYNAATWIDKWIMAFAPDAITLGSQLRTHPGYESAMYLAYLSVVPALALMMVQLETRFYEVYLRFYQQITQRASLEDIRRNHRHILAALGQSARQLVLLQVCICLIGLLVAPLLVSFVGGSAETVLALRYGLVGALFHVLLIAAMTVLAYFDLRRDLVVVAAAFLALNAAFTLANLSWQPDQAGAGYVLAAGWSAVLAVVLAVHRLRRLPYITFVANNLSARGR